MLRRERIGSPPTWVEQVLGLLALITCAAAALATIGGVFMAAYSAAEGSLATGGYLLLMFSGVGGLIVAAFIAFPWEVLRRLRQSTDLLTSIAASNLSAAARAEVAPDEPAAIVDQFPPPPAPVEASAPIPPDVEYTPPARPASPPEPAPAVRIRYRRPGGEIRERVFDGKTVEFVAKQATRQGYEVLEVVEIPSPITMTGATR